MDRRRISDDDDVVLIHYAKRRRFDHEVFDNDSRHHRYTVAWICALHIEMAAARAMLDKEHIGRPRQDNDTNSYVLGSISDHNIVIACLPTDQYGTNNAASVLSNMMRTFPDIQIGLMVGIGGGVPTKADIRLGDVVVGIRVMQYDLGKACRGSFQRTGVPKISNTSIRTVISNLRSRHELNGSHIPSILSDKMNNYPSYCLPDEPDRLFIPSYNHDPSVPACDGCDQSKLEVRKVRLSTNPYVHYGGVASANTVMKDSVTRDEIARELDVICFEMEAAGLMDIIPCLPIRGICDYADSHKTNKFQRYAATTAAAYAYEFLEVWGGETEQFMTESCREHTENCQSSEQRQKLLKSLDFEGIDARRINIKAAHSKTCRWFLESPDYLSWVNPQRMPDHHGFLWIRGKPGAGKSTIMKFIYLRAKAKDVKEQSLTASFFFNSRGKTLEKTVSGMYRSLLLQLFEGFPDLSCVLTDYDIIPRSQKRCPSLNALKHLLRKAVSKLRKRSFACFIDALDECDEQQVMDLVEYFEDLAEQCTADGVLMHVCFSSRHYPYIDVRLGIRLVLEEQMGHASDLEGYIKTHLRVKDSSIFTDLQEKMLEKAAGVFLWVVLVVDVLNQEDRRGRLCLKKRLKEVPNGLSELFENLLRRENTNMDELQLSLLWILLSKRPLKPDEYYHAIWSGLSIKGLADPGPPEVNTTDSKECFDRCVISSSKGLAEITKPMSTVQFIHESVRDFLIKDKGLSQLWPELGPDWKTVGHEKLKRCCYFYFQTFLGQEGSFGPLESSDVHERCAKHPMISYASQFVLHHANLTGSSICQKQFLKEFRVDYWIPVVSFFEKSWARIYTATPGLLYVLAERGYPSLIRTRLMSDPEIDVPSFGERYVYPLIAAMAKGDEESVVTLLQLPPDPQDETNITSTLIPNVHATAEHHTPLSWACEYGHLGVTRVLVSRGALVKEKEAGRRETPLTLAIKNGHAEIAMLLIETGADCLVAVRNETPLFLASGKGLLGVVEALLDRGASPISQGRGGFSTLCQAVYYDRKEVVELLLRRGADIELATASGRQALHFAVNSKESEAIMEVLLRYGADIDARDLAGQTLLFEAVHKWGTRNPMDSLDMIKFLIVNGADINARDFDGRSCLLKAAGTTALSMTLSPGDLLKFLVENGADIHVQDSAGQSCLHIAAKSFYLDLLKVIRILLELGSKVNARNENGESCLHILRERHLPGSYAEDVIQLLISYGADINLRDNNGRTPLHPKTRHMDLDIFEQLLEQPGLNLNPRDCLGRTPLHYATSIQNLVMIGCLVDGGADVNLLDNNGRTPLDIAVSEEYEAAVQLLVEKGALRGSALVPSGG
ncbi:ankyrin protein 3 [Fusarium heterosporum]|uniref:Ankyrin protein 3 n=1 Tax=Fusarium heterosporum TaxID=42747 RepID=A0A8H5T9H7_FUSHE|nr:ankyrin protein 3 [Fusarium heterosporum]